MSSSAQKFLQLATPVFTLLAGTSAMAAWRMRDLGSLMPPGSTHPVETLSVATDVNTSGVAVGVSFAPIGDGAMHAVVWAPGSEIVDLTPCDHEAFARADDLNERGQVVGYDGCNFGGFVVTPEDTDCDGRPDRWFRDDNGDGRNDLEQFLETPCRSSFGNSINEHGEIAGSGCGEIFFWSPHSGYQFIAPSAVGGDDYAHINEAGVVASTFDADDGSHHPFIWTRRHGFVDLGPTPDGGYPYVTAINNNGVVLAAASSYSFVVVPEDTDGDGKPDLWFRDTSPVDGINDLLVTIGDVGSHAFAAGINGFNLVSGTKPLGLSQAFVWYAGSFTMIPPPIGNLASTGALNNLGQVPLVASDSGGSAHGFLWTQALGPQVLASPLGGQLGPIHVSPSGIVAGTALGADGHIYAALWTPDPQVQSATVAEALRRLAAEGSLSHMESRRLSKLITLAGDVLAAGHIEAGCWLTQSFAYGVQRPRVARALSPIEREMLLRGVAALCPRR